MHVDVGESFVAAVATALSLTPAGQESPSRQLERTLRDRRLLLVLDNYEHLMSTRPMLLSLLQNAPGVRALITSREQLGLGGERLLALQGLPIPPASAAASNDELLAYSSARLFFTRALERGVGLILDDEERQSLVHICHLAEGLPLAIDLAATWTSHFTCAEIAANLEANLDFLDAAGTVRVDLPARQRGLRAAFDHAWSLLSTAERLALAQLALLRDPFSREAALVVAEARLIDLISLLNKSLLRQTSPGWYSLHSLVRQYALEQLQSMAAVEAAAKKRQATYFLDFVADRELIWIGATPQQARADIRPVLENARIAWHWAIQQCDWVVLDKALFGLIACYRSEGLLAETVEVLRHLVEHLHPPVETEGIEARLLGRALAYQAVLLIRRDLRADAALELAQAAVEWGQRAADHLTQLLATFARGAALFLAASQGLLPLDDYNRIRESLEHSIALGRQIPATDSIDRQRAQVMEVLSLNMLGSYFSLRGDRAGALRCYDEALAICQATGNVLGEGQTCNAIGELRENEGALEQALHLRHQALRIYQQIDEPDTMSATLGNLCSVLTFLGDYPNALRHGQAALHIRQGNGLLNHLLYYRVALAAFHRGDDAQAQQLVADGLEETAQSPYIYQFRLLAGECATRLERWEEAAVSLQMALALALRGNNPSAAAVVQRAQADLALARGDTAAALGHTEALLSILSGPPLPSSLEPLRLYWACYRALKATGDPRAGEILAAANALLQSQVALIQDSTLRRTFLNQVAANREIAAEWMKQAI